MRLVFTDVRTARASRTRWLLLAGLLVPLAGPPPAVAAASDDDDGPSGAEVRAAMARATEFMLNTVSCRGGFVWKYSLDLKQKYGELKARDSMIWAQPPGTPSVGRVLIAAYKATGDRQYLEYAGRVAGALIWGQRGGWHYFIDFDPAGVQDYYDAFFSRCWGWQEYRHYYGNATFDDQATTAPVRFLLELYRATLDARYRRPLLAALDFILQAQYPNGAWPQRYPPTREFPAGGHEDYTKFYTFNDDVIAGNIEVLLAAYRQLGRREYLDAARRGMDFYLVAQLPRPQAGWAQQYDLDMKPAWGRTFEIGTVSAGQTVSNIHDLMRFYQTTGDRRYLEPIPKALDWLETARMHPSPDASFTHTTFYEMGTNRPVFMRRIGTSYKDIHFVKTYQPQGAYPYGVRLALNIDALGDQYRRMSEQTPEEVRAEYRRAHATDRPPTIPLVSRSVDYRTMAADPAEIRQLIDALDDRGGWVVENHVLNVADPIHGPPTVFPGYDTGTYVARMYRLVHYLESLPQ